MALHTLQVRLKSDTNLPEDDAINVLHFRHSGSPTPADHDDFCTNLAELYRDTLGTLLGGTNAITATSYDVGPPPNYPLGSATVTTSEVASGPREVALCMSYYADNNIPRRRGRIYIGPWRPAALSDRPTGPNQATVLSLAVGLDAMGGSDWQWVIYSPTSGEDHPVTNAWVDNAWDTQRRRGNQPTSRVVQVI